MVSKSKYCISEKIRVMSTQKRRKKPYARVLVLCQVPLETIMRVPEECSSLQRNPHRKHRIISLWDYFADTNETWIAPEKIRSGLKYENSISIFQSWRWCFTFYYTYTLWNEWAFVAINHWKGQKPAEFSVLLKKLSQSPGVSRKGQAPNVKPLRQKVIETKKASQDQWPCMYWADNAMTTWFLAWYWVMFCRNEGGISADQSSASARLAGVSAFASPRHNSGQQTALYGLSRQSIHKKIVQIENSKCENRWKDLPGLITKTNYST